MKKNIKTILSILSIALLLIPITYSYAVEKNDKTEKSFFEISEKEVSKTEKIEMTINLDVIEYEKFVFTLKSSENVDNVEVESDSDIKTLENLSIEKNSEEIEIAIDKNETNLSQITLYYQIPDDVQIGDTIKFTATITNAEENTLQGTESVEKAESTLTKKEETESTENVQSVDSKTIEIDIKIVEEKNNTAKTEITQSTNTEQNKKQNTDTETNQDFTQNIGNNTNTTNQSQNNANTQQVSTNTEIVPNVTENTQSNSNISQNSTSANTEAVKETVTYNGSSNNYLSELSIEGYTLNKEFAKDNSTYFVTVENDVDSLDITATADDDDSSVCIYGNEDFSEGLNKILISVTAENGNVRNYRIYVTKNA